MDITFVSYYTDETQYKENLKIFEKNGYSLVLFTKEKIETSSNITIRTDDVTVTPTNLLNLVNPKTTKIAWIDFSKPLNLTNIDKIYIPKNKVLISRTNQSIFCYAELVSKFAIISTELPTFSEVEKKYPNLIQWYPDSQYPLVTDKRVIVTLMIKNEERIIQRCIQRALSIADAILISDTGSTDNTVKILTDYLPTLAIPAKLVGETWKDFGHNRSLSFLSTQKFCEEIGWDKDQTYSLVLDADMNLVSTPDFNKNQLVTNGYRIKQKNPGIEYYNTRFMKIGHPWKCIGVTHEYWDGYDTDSLDTIYIDDIGDGGCKSDKFTRDEKLLRKGLEEDPGNIRYMFYLAQTLKDLKNLPESIEWYEKRSKAGGWFEEVWYSMYQISRLYYELNKLPEMEMWALKAYEYNNRRSENLYFLTKVFRERSEHFKAWHYMKMGSSVPKTNDMLFVESDVYDHLYDYEKTILNFYTYPERKQEGLKDLINYMNKRDTGSWSNLQFYVSPIQSTIRELKYRQIEDYVATSISVQKQSETEYMLNVRYVNYRIKPDGSYIMSVNNQLSGDNPVRTRNYKLMTDNNFIATSPMEEMVPDFPKRQDVHIQGLEDVRLYRVADQIKWIGTSMEYSHDGRIRQVYGDYNTNENKLQNAISLKSPSNADCEKNWIPLNDNKFIYKWHPYTVGTLNKDTFIQSFTQNTPNVFEHMRGSSNVVDYNNCLWAITHVVIYSTPRKYYHIVVKINKETLRLEQYTMPFYFKNNYIEYCLGIEIRNNTLYAFVSQNDRDPILVEINIDKLEFTRIVTN